MAMFMDERADDQQRQALQMIFSGQVGGWPGEFGKFIGEVRGMEFARIDFHLRITEDTQRRSICGDE
jgi:hypothetical protein